MMMKKYYFIFMLSLIFVACNMQPDTKEIDKSNLELIELNIAVDGMTCEGCENTVQTELLKLDGVGEVNASHLKKTVKVMVDTTITKIDQLEQSIGKVGYTVIK